MILEPEDQLRNIYAGLPHAEAQDQRKHGACHEVTANLGCSGPQGKALRDVPLE